MYELDGRPFAGQRSDVPPVRPRTPSPMREIQAQQAPPPPARDLDVQPAHIDVIYAEDEEVFRETAIHELLKVGFQRENIHEADNGIGALEHLARLQMEGHLSMPLLVLLDVRMPGMDGRECALQIQELVKKKMLRREPFVICISSIHRQVTVDEGKGNFQVVLPKPINKGFLDEALDLLIKWWTLGHGRQLAAWKHFDPSQLEVIAADCEPVCRLASSSAFIRAGVLPDSICEAEDEEELVGKLAQAQNGDADRPLVVLLGTVAWAQCIRNFVEEAKVAQCRRRREPFVVCTSVDSDRIGTTSAVEHFHAFLPKTFSPADVKWCLEFCRLWWQTRGDGPDMEKSEFGHEDSGSEPDSESAGSIGSGGFDD
mmetsp:Transcript_84774/g.213761  ORF Transcript_84774/g.213761 Transcript_84774/m.213761 type:complete len:371 (+) Transcript_84774:208-1320(+)